MGNKPNKTNYFRGICDNYIGRLFLDHYILVEYLTLK